MRLRPWAPHPRDEPRYDAETLRKVTALAARLQDETAEKLSARDIEAIGAEVGLEPAYIQQALAQLAPEPAAPVSTRNLPSRTELGSLVAAWSGLLLWSIFSLFVTTTWVHPLLFTLFTLVFPAGLAALLGFLAGNRKAGFFIGFGALLAMAPAFFRLLHFWFTGSGSGYVHPNEPLGTLLYVLLGGPLAGWIGVQGAKLREHYFPATPDAPLSRTARLQLLFTLQRQLENGKQHCAFLSVDVVGSSAMKQHAAELAVEHSFGQFRAWVESGVHAHGGAVQSAAGDGAMCLFANDADALRAARQLLEELPRFNQERNRLPTPFRIRCGVSAGEVALEPGMPLGHLQSAVVDRAASLQKQAEPDEIVLSDEVAGAALVELGPLTPAPEPVAGRRAFRWRAG